MTHSAEELFNVDLVNDEDGEIEGLLCGHVAQAVAEVCQEHVRVINAFRRDKIVAKEVRVANGVVGCYVCVQGIAKQDLER